MPETMAANQIAERSQTDRLRRSLSLCEQRLKAFRKERIHALKQFCGPHYGGVTATKLPLNVLCGTILALGPQILTGQPKAKVTAKTMAGKPTAGLLAIDLDKWAEEEGFEKRLELVVMDAFFGPSFFWTGIAPGESMDVGDVLLDYGTVVSERVSLDDYRIDPRAKTREAATYEGHVTELPYEYVMDSQTYQNKDSLRPLRMMMEEEGRAQNLSQSEGGPGDGIVDVIRCVELWLPRGFDGRGSPLLVTLPMEGQGDLPLRIEAYDGPEAGPYDDLTYHIVPDNALGLAPVAVYLDLHEEINRYVRKMFRQINRDKVLGIIEEPGVKDGEAIRNAEDGQLVTVQNKDRVSELRLGGASGDKIAGLSALLQLFSRQAGNIDLIAGLDNAAPTLGQEQLLAGNAAARPENMRYAVRKCVRSVLKKVAWYLYNDPMHAPTLKRMLPETDIEVETEFTPEMRAEADVSDYDIDIHPYSWRPDTPEQAAAKLGTWVSQMLLPLAQVAAAQGVAPNAREILERTAYYLGIEAPDGLLQGPMVPPEMMAGLQTPPAGAGGPQRSPGGRITISGSRPALPGQGAPSRTPAARGAPSVQTSVAGAGGP